MNDDNLTQHTIVIGAGPAGLAAGYELARRGLAPLILERGPQIGGLARTEAHQGYRFDIGGHRFFTKVTEIKDLWQDLLRSDFLTVHRLSRIYYRRHFFLYPLNLPNVLHNLGPCESSLAVLSYLRARTWPLPEERSFEQYVINRFGRRIYAAFFKTYTEKVWGIPCGRLDAEWAAQRIASLSFLRVVRSALPRSNGHIKSLIPAFEYPVLGPGMMWQRMQDRIEAWGGQIWLNSEVTGLQHDGRQVTAAEVQRDGQRLVLPCRQVINSMPINDLVTRLTPQLPAEALAAARRLQYRALLIVGLIVAGTNLFPDNWIYVHAPEFRVGRIQNFRNWSAGLAADDAHTHVGMEYFCDEGDAFWTMPDDALVRLAADELAALGLAPRSAIEDGLVIRQPGAYPVYTGAYRQHLEVLRRALSGLNNLQTIGRNGMFRYNNLDHSMLTGLLAARNALGEQHDLWQVNADQEYHEEVTTRRQRAAPQPRTAEEAV